MIYNNNDPMAITAMEMERTGNYGDCYDAVEERCPKCGARDPEFFYLDEDDECIGCTDCIRRTRTLF